MECKAVKLMTGGVAIVCGGKTVARRQPKKCRCGGVSTKLCDFPVRGAKNKTTCDEPLCDACAVRIGEDRDLCPTHAKVWKGAA